MAVMAIELMEMCQEGATLADGTTIGPEDLPAMQESIQEGFREFIRKLGA